MISMTVLMSALKYQLSFHVELTRRMSDLGSTEEGGRQASEVSPAGSDSHSILPGGGSLTGTVG